MTQSIPNLGLALVRLFNNLISTLMAPPGAIHQTYGNLNNGGFLLAVRNSNGSDEFLNRRFHVSIASLNCVGR